MIHKAYSVAFYATYAANTKALPIPGAKAFAAKWAPIEVIAGKAALKPTFIAPHSPLDVPNFSIALDIRALSNEIVPN